MSELPPEVTLRLELLRIAATLGAQSETQAVGWAKTFLAFIKE
jgi:hypothetical protein